MHTPSSIAVLSHPPKGNASSTQASFCWFAVLTERERTVITFLRDGMTAAAIAHRLGISPRTVHKHLENIYAKLGVSDRLGAVLCIMDVVP